MTFCGLFGSSAELRFKQEATEFVLRAVLDGRGGREDGEAAIPVAHQVAGLLRALGEILDVVERVDEALGAEAVEGRVHIGLQGKHIGGGKLSSRLEHLVNAV